MLVSMLKLFLLARILLSYFRVSTVYAGRHTSMLVSMSKLFLLASTLLCYFQGSNCLCWAAHFYVSFNA